MLSKSTSISIDTERNQTGIAIASLIILLWISSLIGFVSLEISKLPLILIIMGILLRSFLHTGLFIIIHEAIHGVISPNRRINDSIGYVTSRLYALQDYQLLAKNHHLHHRHPATEKDPDFDISNPNNPLLWYGNFMKRYQEGKQGWVLFWGMTVIFWTSIYLHISAVSLIVFWVLPILISSWQLFIFGIFLPHRQQKSNNGDRHRAKSTNYSVFWSFVTCYHFGYHWEHHQYPHLPWYRLPKARQKHQCTTDNYT